MSNTQNVLRVNVFVVVNKTTFEVSSTQRIYGTARTARIITNTMVTVFVSMYWVA